MTDPLKYSTEWVIDQIEAKEANWLDHHRCSLCNSMIGYAIDRAAKLVDFQSACACSWSPPRASSPQDIANWLGMQSSDEIRDRIMEGLRK